MSQAAERRISRLEAQVAQLQTEIEQLRAMVRWNDPDPLRDVPPPPRQLAEHGGLR